MTTTVGTHRFRYVAPPASPSPGALWDYFVRQNDEIARAINPVRSVADGGTGTDTFVAGDILVSTAANSLSRLAIGSPNQVLTVVSGLPAWQTPSSTLDSLTDVTITSASDQQTLRYNSGTGQWINNSNLLVGTDVAIANVLVMNTAASRLVPGATSFAVRNNANSADNLLISNAGDVTVRARLLLATAAGKVVPGATSISFRNTADTADNLLIVDAGTATFRGQVNLPGPLNLTTAVSKILPGATSLSLRNTADSADNILIADGGAVTFRGALSGATTITGNDTLTINQVDANVGINLVQTSAVNANGFAVSGGTLTGSNASNVLSLAQTWNTTGAPVGIKLTITNTASGSASYLMQLLVGATDIFHVDVDSGAQITSTAAGASQLLVKGAAGATNGLITMGNTGGQAPFQFNYDSTTPRFFMGFSGSTGADIIFYAKGTGTGQTHTFKADGTMESVTGGVKHHDTTLIHTSIALTNGAGAGVGTITNAPAAGNPTKWVPIDDNGTTRYVPAW